MRSNIYRCKKCLLPETHETIIYDENGVCNVCHQHEYKQENMDWCSKKEELDDIIEKYRGKYDYDCIVPYSGGKDSTFTLYYLVKEYQIKPLVIRFDHGFMRPNLHRNTTKVLRKLGVDFLIFQPNWSVVQKLMLQSYLEKGDFCWHCHTGIFAYPMWVALEKEIPLIIWGEPSAEYTSYYSYEQPEEVDEKRFNRFVNLGITAQDMLIRLEGLVEARDLKPYTYPPLKRLRQLKYRSICLGSFIPWDVKRQSGFIQEELGWKGDEVENVPPGYEYEKIECYLQGVRDYIKFIKRGYSRPSHLASLDIRNQRLDRQSALELISEYEGKRPPSLDLFLDYIGLAEEEFMEVAMSHAVSPFEFDPESVKEGRRTHDYESWPRGGRMPRAEVEILLERWRKRTGKRSATAA